MPTAVKKKKPATPNHFRAPVILFAEIDDEVSERVELLRCGTFSFSPTEQLEITPELMQSFVKNFNDNVRGVDLAIDYAHENKSIAAGWIKKLSYDAKKKKLFADVKWTPAGKKVLADKEFRYLSAEFHTNYTDNETNSFHGPTLLGAGLTNRPFVKGMEAVTQLSEENPGTGNGVMCMTPEEMTAAIQAIQAALEKLSAGGAAVPSAPPVANAPIDSQENDGQDDENNEETSGEENPVDDEANPTAPPVAGAAKSPVGGAPAAKDLKNKKPPPQAGGATDKGKSTMTDAEKKDYEDMKAENLRMKGEQDAAAKKVKLAEREGVFTKMLSEGKAVEAQRKPYLDGDVDGFMALAQPVKTKRLSEDGAEGNEDGGGEGEKDPQDEIIALAEKLVEDKKVKTLSEAQSVIMNDPKHAALRKRYEDGSYNSGQSMQRKDSK